MGIATASSESHTSTNVNATETTPLYLPEFEMYLVRSYKNYGFDPYLHETTRDLAMNVVREVFLLWDHEQPSLQVTGRTEKDKGSIQKHRDDAKRTYSFAASLGKRDGTMRTTMLQKRTDYNSRHVATPNTGQMVDSITLPIRVLMEQTFPSRVTIKNLSACQRLVINGPDVYPGANFVIDLNTRTTFDLRYVDRFHFAQCLLKPGMVVRRHLQTGDPTFVNRPPTLTKDNINCQKVRAGSGTCAQIHPFAMEPYDMDGDGDHVTNFYPQSEEVAIEAQHLLPLENNIINNGTLKPHICFSESALSAAYSLSRQNIFLSAGDFARYASQMPTKSCRTIEPALVIRTIRHGRDVGILAPQLVTTTSYSSFSSSSIRVYYTGLQLLSTSLPENFTYTGCAQTNLSPLYANETARDLETFRTADEACLENECMSILDDWLGIGQDTCRDDSTIIVSGRVLLSTCSIWKNTSGCVLHALAYSYPGKDVLMCMNHQADILHKWADEEGKSFSMDDLHFAIHNNGERSGAAASVVVTNETCSSSPVAQIQRSGGTAVGDVEEQQCVSARNLSEATLNYHKSQWELKNTQFGMNSIVDLLRSGAMWKCSKIH